MVFGYHRYNIWRHQWQMGKPFKSRKVSFSRNFVNNNYQIQKICMEQGRYCGGQYLLLRTDNSQKTLVGCPCGRGTELLVSLIVTVKMHFPSNSVWNLTFLTLGNDVWYIETSSNILSLIFLVNASTSNWLSNSLAFFPSVWLQHISPLCS